MTGNLTKLALAFCLAACTAPAPSGCDPAAARELRTIDRLIAETRRVVETGYRTETAPAPTGFNLCLGSARSHVGVSFCTNGAGRTRTVAIDPEGEARKLDLLLDRRAALLAAHPACSAPE